MVLDQAQAAVERGGITGTQVGGLMAIAGGFTLNTWLALGGFLIALLSFCITWYYKQKHYELARLRLEADLADKGDDDEP